MTFLRRLRPSGAHRLHPENPLRKTNCSWASGGLCKHRRLVLENKSYQLNLQQQVDERTQQLTVAITQLEQSYDDTLEALGSALDLKDAETEGHCQRVTAFTISIAKAVPDAASLFTGAGSRRFSSRHRQNGDPRQNTSQAGAAGQRREDYIMRTHCEIGYNMLTKIPFLRDAAEIVLAHQEFFDGTGLSSAIARRTDPSWGPNLFPGRRNGCHDQRPPVPQGLCRCPTLREEIRRCAGTQFDPKIVEVFLSGFPNNTGLNCGKTWALRSASPI